MPADRTALDRLVENGIARAIADLVVRRIEAARAAVVQPPTESEREHSEAVDR